MHNKGLMILVIFMLLSGCSAPPGVSDIATEIIPATEMQAATMAPEAATTTMVPAPDGWLTYEDAEHGFYFHYPPAFEVLTDADSLYGWENGLVLLYNGGQSYDIAIQIWDSSAEMEAVYGRGDARMHVFEQGSQLISVMNITNEADSEGIIASFSVR